MQIKIRNFANALALTVVLFAQLAMAQHFTVHFLEHDGDSPAFHTALDDHHKTGHAPDKDEVCQICVGEKALTYAVWHGGVLLPLPLLSEDPVKPMVLSEPFIVLPLAYNAQGPPVLS